MVFRLLLSLTVLGVYANAANTLPAAECRAKAVCLAKAEDAKNIVETAAGAEDFSTLVAAVKAAGLVDVLVGEGPFTVFAPTNEAFASLPEGTVENLLKSENKESLIKVLTYHVVPGKVLAADVVKLEKATTASGMSLKIKTVDGKVMVNDSEVVKTDIECSNGVIHVINSVLLPPADEAAANNGDSKESHPGKHEEKSEKKDIVDTAATAKDFTTLVALVKAADLVETLKGEGPFTILAPSDRAFGKLPKGTVDSLLKPESKEKLTAILMLHVIKGKVLAEDVVKVKEIESLGGKLAVKVEGDVVTVNKAKVVAADVDCANGVIHVIDTVILP